MIQEWGCCESKMWTAIEPVLKELGYKTDQIIAATISFKPYQGPIIAIDYPGMQVGDTPARCDCPPDCWFGGNGKGWYGVESKMYSAIEPVLQELGYNTDALTALTISFKPKEGPTIAVEHREILLSEAPNTQKTYPEHFQSDTEVEG